MLHLIFETSREAVIAEKEISQAKGYPKFGTVRWAIPQQRPDGKWYFRKPPGDCSSGECGTGPSCVCSMRWVSVDFTEEHYEENWGEP